MNETHYYSMQFVGLQGKTTYFIPIDSRNLVPQDIVEHLIKSGNQFNRHDHIEEMRKTKQRVYIIKSILPFASHPSYKPLKFVKDHGETFNNLFKMALRQYRDENHLPTPVNYEEHSRDNHMTLKPAAISSKKTIAFSLPQNCDLSKLEEIVSEQMLHATNNSTLFFRNLVKLPFIDQICPDTSLRMLWPFLTCLILEKYGEEEKKKAYLHSLLLYSQAMNVLDQFVLENESQANICFEGVKSALNALIEGVHAQEREQLIALYTPLICWLESLFKLTSLPHIDYQISTWIDKINNTKLSDQCSEITQVASSKQYLWKWIDQSLSLFRIALSCTPYINKTMEKTQIQSIYLTPLSKALMFHEIYAANQILSDINKETRQILDQEQLEVAINMKTKKMIYNLTFEQYQTLALQQAASNFLKLIGSFIERDSIHQIISQERVEEVIHAQHLISQFDHLPKPNLKPILDWARELASKGAAPQAFNQLTALNESWTDLKRICLDFSLSKPLSQLLDLCKKRANGEGTDLRSIAQGYFLAVEEINTKLPLFHGILEKINEQVCAFQGIIGLSKSDLHLPQIKTTLLIEQLGLMNERLKSYIQPAIDLLNGFQQLLQFNQESQKTELKNFSELTLKFKTEEITVHLFAVNAEVYATFDQLVAAQNNTTKEQASELIVEIDLPEQVSHFPIQQPLKESVEKKIQEIFEHKKTKKIQKKLFEFFKEENIDFKLLFGKGDHLKLYLNGSPIPMPQHTEWKPGTKHSIEKSVLEDVKRIKQ